VKERWGEEREREREREEETERKMVGARAGVSIISGAHPIRFFFSSFNR
jgi:hypothetical protein